MLPEIDKAKLLDLLEAEYEFVHRTIDDLSNEIMLTPNVDGEWSIKDSIAHMSAWMKRVLRWFAEIEAHQSPNIPDVGYTWQTVHDLNDAQTAKDKHRSLDDIIGEFHDTYSNVYRLIANLSENDLFVNTFNGLVDKPMWGLVVSDTYEHFREHIVPIREWLAKNT